MIFLQSTQATVAIALSLFASLANGNPVPELLEKRLTCWSNYTPACCTFVQFQSWPSIVPGASNGCVAQSSEPGGVCPTTGANTQACCQAGFFTDHTPLHYQPDGTVYCYIP